MQSPKRKQWLRPYQAPNNKVHVYQFLQRWAEIYMPRHKDFLRSRSSKMSAQSMPKHGTALTVSPMTSLHTTKRTRNRKFIPANDRRSRSLLSASVIFPDKRKKSDVTGRMLHEWQTISKARNPTRMDNSLCPNPDSTSNRQRLLAKASARPLYLSPREPILRSTDTPTKSRLLCFGLIRVIGNYNSPANLPV